MIVTEGEGRVSKRGGSVGGGAIVARTYPLMERCVDSGVALGYNRAHKHGVPDEWALKEAIAAAVMVEIAEAFQFTDWKGDSDD